MEAHFQRTILTKRFYKTSFVLPFHGSSFVKLPRENSVLKVDLH